MTKKKSKFRVSDEMKEKVRMCGSVNFPLLDMVKMLGISVDDFSASDELMDIYRNAQLETALTVRLKLLGNLVETGDVKTAKLFLEQFSANIIPDPKDMDEKQ